MTTKEERAQKKSAWEQAWNNRITRETRKQAKTIEHLRQQRQALQDQLEATRVELDGIQPQPQEVSGEPESIWTKRLTTVGELGWLRELPAPRRALLTYQEQCVLPLGKVGFFIGEGGVGKSWALCQMAISIASGVPWFQTFEVPKEAQGHVLLAMGEEDTEELHRRIFQATEGMALEAGELANLEARIWPMALAGEFVEFLREGEVSWEHERFEKMLTQWAPEEGWRLIVLDPASRFMGVDAEKDNAFATRFVQLLERLTKLPGQPTVLCAHHTSKVSRQAGGAIRAVAARGSSALTDGARWQGNIAPCYDSAGEPLDGLAMFQVTKSNYGPMPPPIYLQRGQGTGVLGRIQDPTASGTKPRAADDVAWVERTVVPKARSVTDLSQGADEWGFED